MKVPFLNHGIKHIENISMKVLAPLIQRTKGFNISELVKKITKK
jgi:hypothetical protein